MYTITDDIKYITIMPYLQKNSFYFWNYFIICPVKT